MGSGFERLGRVVAIVVAVAGGVARGQTALWTEPFGIAAGFLAPGSTHALGAYLPLGFSWKMDEHLDGLVELGPYVGVGGDCPESTGCRRGVYGTTASFGLVFLYSGNREGFDGFLGFKLMGAFADERGTPGPVPGDASFVRGLSYEAGVGLDIGFEYRQGSFYAAFFVGLDVAYDWSADLESRGTAIRPGWPAVMLAMRSQVIRSSGMTWGLNLNFARIGFAF